MSFMIGLIYTVVFISIAYSLAQIAAHLKGIRESLERIQISVGKHQRNHEKGAGEENMVPAGGEGVNW